MARRWEEFVDPGTSRIAELHVSMAPKGMVIVSHKAYEALGEPGHIVLLWESETDTIGLRPVPPRTTNAFRLYPSKRAGAYRFHALRFLRKHDIRLEYTVRFPTATIEDGVLLLELPYRVRAGHGIPRAARRK
ncbi:MAG: hypothetical protein ACKVRN_08880 [Pyrinomonadaceae bacterium]